MITCFVFSPTMKQNLLNPISYKSLKIISISGRKIGEFRSEGFFSNNGNIVLGRTLVIVNNRVPKPPVVITAVFIVSNSN